MTTTIKVTSHNYPACVEIVDNGKLVSSSVVLSDDGEKIFYCTTSREIRIVDLEYDDPAVLEEKAKRETV